MRNNIKMLGVLCLLSLVLVACGTKNDKDVTNEPEKTITTEEKKLTVAEFLDEAEKANNEVETVHFDMDLSLQVNTNKKTQKMRADIDYGKQGDTIQRANALIDEVNNGQPVYQEYILPGGDGNPVYSRTSKDGAWNKQSSDGHYFIQPGYFSFLKILYSMENDLELTESDDEYTLVLKSQNVDLLSLFKDELNLSITGVSQTEVNKVFEVTFDKDNYYMTGFKMTFDYEGDAGELDMDIETEFSDWNQLDDSTFQAPDNVGSLSTVVGR